MQEQQIQQEKQKKLARLRRRIRLQKLCFLLLAVCFCVVSFRIIKRSAGQMTAEAESEIPWYETLKSDELDLAGMKRAAEKAYAKAKHFFTGKGEAEETPEPLRFSVNGKSWEVPGFTKEAYAEVNSNVPFFTEAELNAAKEAEPYARYSPLDALHRCQAAEALLDESLMPKEERGEIDTVRPSGFRGAVYDHIDGGFLYHRCHLIAYTLTGENANERNLITGTRFLNMEGMLPFELQLAEYVREGGNVLLRVTPVFLEEELLCRGVLMEAYSVADAGKDISFNVFLYNAEPGVTLDYKTGRSHLAKQTGAI